MKKILCISLIILLASAICFGVLCLDKKPTYAKLYEDAAASLSNPTSIAVSEDNLFIADTVNENSSDYTIVHWVTDSDTRTLFADFLDQDNRIIGATQKVQANSTHIFLMQSDKIYIYDYASTTPTLKVFAVTSLQQIAVSGNYLYYYYLDEQIPTIGAVDYTQSNYTPVAPLQYDLPIWFLITDTQTAGQAIIYYNVTIGSTTTTNERCIKIDTTGTEQKISNLNVTKNDEFASTTKGIFDLNGSKRIFNPNGISSIADRQTDLWQNGEILLNQVAVSADTLYILCDFTSPQISADTPNPYYDKPRVLVATFDATQSRFIVAEWSIGASELNTDIPSFLPIDTKKATVTGYPSNVIYIPKKLSSTYSPIQKNKLEPTDNILVLAATPGKKYLYICLDGSFGWIQNSDKVIYDTTPSTTLPMQIVSPAHVYSLPFDNQTFLTSTMLPITSSITQTADYGDFLQIKYTRSQTERYGFVRKAAVGPKQEPPTLPTYQRFTANPKAGQLLDLYKTQDCDTIPDNLLKTAEGTPIGVKSGTEVRLYQTLSNGVCFVGVQIDGTLQKGYITSQQLLKNYRKGLTNTQVLAIALLSIVIIVIVFLIVIRVRAKRLLISQTTHAAFEPPIDIIDETTTDNSSNTSDTPPSNNQNQ